MPRRYLLVGDPFWGDDPGTPELATDLILCGRPTVPLQFFLSTNPRNTMASLLTNCAREILGRQADVTVLCLAWKEIQDGLDGVSAGEALRLLVNEIVHNSSTSVWVLTLPECLLLAGTRSREAVADFNQSVRQIPGCTVMDFDAACTAYQSAQAERGEWARNLLAEDGNLSSLGRTLLARLIASSVN